MSKISLSQKGFAHVGLVLPLVVVLGVIGGGGYYVWHKNHEQKKASGNSQADKKTTKITNYEECTKSEDAKIQESYPATCVTKDGQHFIQDATAAWKKYRNQKYDISFKYPDNSYVISEGNSLASVSSKSSTHQEYFINLKLLSDVKYSERIAIEVLGQPIDAAEQWYENYYAQSPETHLNKRSITINGRQAVELVAISSGNMDEVILFSVGNKTYSFWNVNESLTNMDFAQTFQSILNTVTIAP
jgi:hypothetical protein